jgi:hypothetical protein
MCCCPNRSGSTTAPPEFARPHRAPCAYRPQAQALSPPRRCRIMGKVYLMACCLRCGAGQGDGAVDRLLTSLHPRVPVRVPIPPARGEDRDQKAPEAVRA